MKIDEMKALLMGILADDADRAGIIDSVIEQETIDREAEEARLAEERDADRREIERMRGEIDALNRTNERLLSKIKYGKEADEMEEEPEDNTDITIDDLFKED